MLNSLPKVTWLGSGRAEGGTWLQCRSGGGSEAGLGNKLIVGHCICKEPAFRVPRKKVSLVTNFDIIQIVLLTTITMLYVRSPKFTHLTDWRFVLFDQHLPSSPTPTLLVTSILLSASMSFAFWDFIYKWYHTVFIFLHLAKFTYTLRVYSCCKWQDVLVSHGWKKSQGTHTHTHIPHNIYLFVW